MQKFESFQGSQVEFLEKITSILQEVKDEMDFTSFQDCGRLMLIHQLLQKNTSSKRRVNALRLAYQMLVQSHKGKVQVSPPQSFSTYQFLETMIQQALLSGNWNSAVRLRESSRDLIEEKSSLGSISIMTLKKFCQSWVVYTQEYLEFRLKEMIQMQHADTQRQRPQSTCLC